MSERVGCGVAVLIWRSTSPGRRELLFHKRKGKHGEGEWSLPGGWMEHGESFEEAATRELFEETGLLMKGPVEVVDAMSTVWPGIHSVTVLVRPASWEGTPVVKEPDKIDGEWQWFSPDRFPSPFFKPLTQSAYFKRLEMMVREGIFE